MRQFITLFAIVAALSITAQCSTSNLGYVAGTQPVRIHGLDVGAASQVTVAKPYLPNGTLFGFSPRGIRVTKNDLNGQLQWERRLVPTNASINMVPRGVLTTQDDGLFVYGDLGHANYTNQFGIKLASDGTREWARIYMLPDSAISTTWPYTMPGYQGQYSAVRNGLDQLANGGYAWVIQNELEFYHILLDPNGIPIQARAYGDGTIEDIRAEVRTTPDGGLFSTYYGVHNGDYRGCYFRTGPDGQVDWAYRVENTMCTEPQPILAANGDYLMEYHLNAGLGRQLIRIDPAGTPIWARVRPLYGASRGFVELNDGTFLDAQGSDVLWIANNGAILNRWTITASATDHLATNGSHIAFSKHYYNQSPLFSLATDMPDLIAGCGLTINSSQTTTTPAVVTNPVTIDVDTALVKTWTLALGDVSPTALDLHAGCVMGFARPGFGTYIVGAAANASASISGPLTVTCTLPGPLTTTTITPTPTSVNGNVISWLVPNGLPGDGYWDFHIYATVDADTALIGTALTTTVVLTQDSVEVDLTNNTASYDRIVTASFDPNAKEVRTSSGTSNTEYYPGLDHYLDYTIHFQNTGSDTAFTVVLVDTLPAELAVGTLSVLGATHHFTYELNGAGILRFTFNDILLPDSTTNEAASHGMVSFRIQPDDGLNLGTVIANRADIFFDFNPPVRTDDATVTIEGSTAVPEPVVIDLAIFPVPVRDQLSIVIPNSMRPVTWTIHGTDGRLVRSGSLRGAITRLDLSVSDLGSGSYILTLEDTDGTALRGRFVKE